MRKASFDDDCANFVDFIIKPKKGKLAKIQVKNRNTPGRGCSPDDSHITLELKNTIGKDGWLYGDSNFLAKEVELYLRLTLIFFCRIIFPESNLEVT